MPRRRAAAVAAVEDDQIQKLALRFAGDVARIVRQGIATEVTAQIARVLDGISRGGSQAARLSTVAGDRRIGKAPVPVVCPVPGCRSVGIRAKRNFCQDHAGSLSDAEKARLRHEQLAARTGGGKGRKARAAAPVKAAAVKAAAAKPAQAKPGKARAQAARKSTRPGPSAKVG